MAFLTRVLLLLAFVVTAACGSSPAPTPPAAPAGKTVDSSSAGTITGRISFTGAVPPAETIRMNTDRNCVQNAGPNPQSDALLVGEDGGVKNVFVHVKDGLDASYTFAVPTEPVVLDQRGCIYSPRVLGVRAGQSLTVRNSDPTFHNVHALPMLNVEFNKSTPTQGASTTQTFTAPEVMVRFKCDAHSWMAAWVGVTAHPYFAVTDASGTFEIRNLPAGSYTLEAWHEVLGSQTSKVTVAERQTQTAAFTFAAK